ncbi:MAG TPA: hypothetical protein VGM30_10435 [Puia sp.]|jgi:hypothetical protein
MNKEEIKRLILDQGLTAIGLVEAIIEINGYTGIGLLALYKTLKDYCHTKIKGIIAKSGKNHIEGEWTMTDPSTNQYGRQLSRHSFEFKEINRGQEVIDIHRYTVGDIESTINSYGYTLFESKNGNANILEQYGESTQWIIAECLFEMQV